MYAGPLNNYCKKSWKSTGQISSFPGHVNLMSFFPGNRVTEYRWAFAVLVLFPSVVNSHENHDSFDNIQSMEQSYHYQHRIRVSMSGHDAPECLKNISTPCEHLHYVFEKIMGQNSTVVFVDWGHYVLNKSYTFKNVKNVALIGLPGVIGVVTIQCQGNAGLSYIYSRGIIMKNITLSSCGAMQNSTSIQFQKFFTGLFLVNCINFSMDSVKICNSPGIGIQLYDVTGIVNIYNSHITNNGERKLERHIPGGGFYFEFTFDGGLYPSERTYQENGTFHFSNVWFDGNTAPSVAETVNPGGKIHNAFGRGGGASFFIKGSAQNNTFVFENCHFEENGAEWGAGLFAEFQDNTENNRFIFQSCNFTRNNASLGGGAVRFGLITMNQTANSIPNSLRLTLCHFTHNNAILGGGISLYGTTKHSYSGFPHQSFIMFAHCTINFNLATVGSAFSSTLWNTNKYGVGSAESFKLWISNSTIENNTIIYTEDKKVSGTGAFYAKGTPIILKNTKFISNTKTALVVDNAVVEVVGNVSFINNTGRRGGAMSLYGFSWIKVSANANLNFTENKCSLQGGAIYVRAPGPQMVAFTSTELRIHRCFFEPDNVTCNCSISFHDNKSPNKYSGHSVYATTLQFCRRPNEARVNNLALERDFFHYYTNGNKSDMKYEIVTDAINMEINNSDWDTAAGKSFSPLVKLTDEKSNSVVGVINITIDQEHVELVPRSTYFIVKDSKIESLQIQGQPKTRYDISLETVQSQILFRQISNANITHCEPGFVWQGSSCQCDVAQIGLSRCDGEKQNLFLLKGYWGGYEKSSEDSFVIVQCPKNYCQCSTTNQTSSFECLFEKDKQCSGNRDKQLCGMCKKGFSLKIGEDKCSSKCNPGSKKWIGYLIGLLLLLTLLVLIIMRINFDPFSAYLNAWLYSYQVLIILVPVNVSLDPFLMFINGLSHIQIVGFGGICMWSNMDDLKKLAFNYLLPFYFFICLYVLHKVVVAWPNNFFTRRFTQTSLARAFCTIIVLSYSTVVNISLKILYPIKIGDHYYVFYQGNVKYFCRYHAGFAVVALLLVIFVGILFPLILVRREWFRSIDNGLKRLLLDNFQRCFRDGYEWCAGLYFVCRFILLVINHFVSEGALQVSLLNSVCCIILTVFVLCQPYVGEGGTVVPYRILNISDAVLLCNLCLISSFGGAASGIYGNSYPTVFKIVIFILSYIPLLFSLGLLVYVLRHRCMAYNRLLEDVQD